MPSIRRCSAQRRLHRQEEEKMIEIRELTKAYRTRHGQVLALDRVDLSIQTGDIFGIVGLSGAGKSTLIRCINRLEKPTSGSVDIDGTDITKLHGRQLRRFRSQIGMIFQGFNLFMQRTVEKNIAFPLELAGIPREQRQQRIEEVLKLVGLEDKAKAYPSQLSGGQQQRVSIARALASKPRILLCDEPTSALDSLTTASILKLLKSINEELNVTIVIITHEIGVVKTICNNMAVIDANRIVETGPVSQMFNSVQSDIARKLLGLEEVNDGSGI